MILGLVIVVTFQGGALVRGALMAALGLLVATVGIFPGTGSACAAGGCSAEA